MFVLQCGLKTYLKTMSAVVAVGLEGRSYVS